MKEKLLILGGTEFVGRQLVETLWRDSSYDIFLFNRGKTNPDLFPEVQLIKGDRETDDIKLLKEHKWDYVIDFSSYYPGSLRKTLAQINRDVKQYIYISTISVYDFGKYDTTFEIREDFEQMEYTAEELLDKTLKTYGKQKAACELVLNESEWLNKTILRPSVIYGKYDPTDRLYFWLKKIRGASKVILPNNGAFKLSLTFSDDLVQIIRSILRGKINGGIYNCSTHPPMAIKEMMDIIKGVLKSNCEFIDIDIQALRTAGIRYPLFFGKTLMIDNSKLSQSVGLTFTPFKESIESTVSYYKGTNWKKCIIEVDEELEQPFLNDT